MKVIITKPRTRKTYYIYVESTEDQYEYYFSLTKTTRASYTLGLSRHELVEICILWGEDIIFEGECQNVDKECKKLQLRLAL